MLIPRVRQLAPDIRLELRRLRDLRQPAAERDIVHGTHHAAQPVGRGLDPI